MPDFIWPTIKKAFEIFFYVLAGSGGIWVLYRFVFQKLVSHFFDRKLAELKQTLEKDSEKFRSDLRRDAYEHEIRFSKLHERRMEVIAEVFAHIVEVHKAIVELTKAYRSVGEPTEEEKRIRVVTAANIFKSYFDKNRIYFKEELCAKIDAFHEELRQVWITYDIFLREDSHEKGKERVDKAEEVWQKVSITLFNIKKEIEQEFRRLMEGGAT